jgi:two-component system chemotaxis response regulator CheB
VGVLATLCAGLPRDLPAAMFVVQHISPGARSVLPALLDRAGGPPSFHPEDGDEIRPGWIHVARPDHHLLLSGGRVLVRRGPKENGTRPAIDPLFRSAAVQYGPRVVGVVLTGLLDDGSAGLLAIKRCGGVCVVQDPGEAPWPDMPRNALERDHVDHCLSVARLPALLLRLASETAGEAPPVPRDLIAEVAIATGDRMQDSVSTTPGRPSPMSCPDCGGVLNEIEEDGTVRYRCQTGHAYAPETLAASQRQTLEMALYSALRAHMERVTLFTRMVEKAEGKGHLHNARLWQRNLEEARRDAEVIREAIEGLGRAAAAE